MKATSTVVGRLTRDVTSIFSNEDGGSKRALFTVACNSVYKRDNEKVKTTDFIPCIAWGPHAELLKEWGLKGRLVIIKGTLETYQKPVNDDGSYDPTKVQVRVGQIEFLGFEDNVRDKYEAAKSSAPTEQNAILNALAALLTGKAQTPPAPPAPPAPTPQPGMEALAAKLLEAMGTETEPTYTAGNTVTDELSNLV